MTDVADQEATVVDNPLTRLKTARAARPRAGATRRVASRQPARKPTASRAESAAKRGKYADRIVGAIKAGAALLSVRAPVQAAIITARAEPFARALDRVAAEDKRVDAFLTRVSGWFGKSTAWGELGGEVATMGAALMIAGGAVPTGPVGIAVAFLGGKALEAGVVAAAYDQAEAILTADGMSPTHPDWTPLLTRTAQAIADGHMQAIHEKAKPAPPADDPTPTTAVPADVEPEPSWQ